MPAERVVQFRPRTILMVAGILLVLVLALWVLWMAHRVIVWMFISAFLAMALQPGVRWLQAHGVQRRGTAAGIVYLVAFVSIAAIAALFIPTLVSQVNDFIQAVPGYARDLTHGRGSLGFLERRYHIVERVQDAVNNGGGAKLAPASAATALAIGKTLLSIVAATVTIAFMTFFMLMEGPAWMERFYATLPEDEAVRWRRVGSEIANTVSGYVTGNLLISLVAGGSAALVLTLIHVPFSVALGLWVAITDLIPLAGATIGAIVCILVALTVSPTAALIALVWFIVYQQLENHLLQPLIYGRTVKLSPLTVLVAVLIGAELGGIIGALAAIPVAGSLQVILLEWLRRRGEKRVQPEEDSTSTPTTTEEPRFTPAA
jgi:predicted PurR-regulated permease PerM